jgi:hypothetical protein
MAMVKPNANRGEPSRDPFGKLMHFVEQCALTSEGASDLVNQYHAS